jgi:hypothetical protein
MTKRPTKPTPSTCPKCGTPGVPFLYGYPTAEDFEREKRGELAIGGCCVKSEMPAFRCGKCGEDFGRREF